MHESQAIYNLVRMGKVGVRMAEDMMEDKSFRVQGLVGFSNYAGSFLPRDAGVLVLC